MLKKIVTTFLLFLSTINIQKSNALNVRSIADTALINSLFLIKPVIAAYMVFRTNRTLEEHYKEIKAPEILKFLTEEAKKITDTPIKFYKGSAIHFFQQNNSCIALAVGNNSIIITPEYYKTIKEAINNPIKEDKKTINMIKFVIQHEANHIKNKDIQKGIHRLAIETIAKIASFETAKRTLNIPFKFQVLLACTLEFLGDSIVGIFNKQDEIRADSNIVGIDAISGGKEFFKKHLKLIEDNLEAYWHDKYNPSHPPLQERLENLKAQEKKYFEKNPETVTA